MLSRCSLCLITIAAVARCGAGSGTPAANPQGVVLTLGDKSYTMTSAAVARTLSGDLPSLDSQETMALIFSPDFDVCAALKTSVLKKSSIFASLLAVSPQNGSPIVIGTYTDFDGGATLTSTDSADCADAGTHTGMPSGSLTLDELGSASEPTTGSVDLSLGNGAGSLKGSFSAAPCLYDQNSQRKVTCE